MTGYKNFNYDTFARAAAALRDAGRSILSAHEIEHGDTPGEYQEYLRRDLIAMLTECDTIILLPGWHESTGAKLEYHVAVALGFAVEEYGS